MSKKDIIIVGAGHGGLIVAYKLAQQGFNVTIYEKSTPDKISWDWRDNIEPEAFEHVGIPIPDSYCSPESYYFISPNEKHHLATNIPLEKRDITIERRYLTNYLIKFVQDAGAKIIFNTAILAPLIEDDIIVGVKTEKEEIRGNLIIDSAGINSPIRSALPLTYNMNVSLKRGEKFFTYRAYYNKNPQIEESPFFRLIIGFKNKQGIAWVNTSNEYADVLIGCIDPFEKGEIDFLLAALRKNYPIIGEKLERGGIIAPIPIRRPAPMLIGPNLALIGDTAFMTRPINGSGVANSMLAGIMLADTIIEAQKKTESNQDKPIFYPIKDLWQYPYRYFTEIGAENSFIDVLKDYLMTIEFENMDFAFEKRLLTPQDIEASTYGGELRLTLFNLIGRLIRGCKRIGILLELGKTIRKGKSLQKHIKNIPQTYDEQQVNAWIAKINTYFEAFYYKLESGFGKLSFQGD